ncbi:MAG TPA: hypothetical protein VHM19_15830 [Polyangiales bacterium]|nr:hypothetical protein [Polyangiales bacterium]
MFGLGRARWLAVSVVIGAFGATVAVTPRAHAQHARELEVERFVPATGPDSYFGVEATRTPGPGKYTLQLTGDYAGDVETSASASGDGVGRLGKRVATWLGGEVGVGGRLALGARLPITPWQRYRASTSARDENDGVQLGDARVHGRYRLIGESSSKEDAAKDGPGLALSAVGVLPTNTGHVATGERSLRTELSLLADFQLFGAGAAANLGWRHRFEDVAFDRVVAGQGQHVRYHDELLFGAALKLRLPPAPKIETVLETRGATDFRSKLATSVEVDLGAHFLFGAFTVSFGGGLGFGSGLGTPDGRVLLGLAFSPLTSDSDHDGIDDDVDECPFMPEDRDGFQDTDGCADPDNDNDQVLDLDDLCPTQPAEEGKDENEDGCTDGTTPTRKP